MVIKYVEQINFLAALQLFICSACLLTSLEVQMITAEPDTF
jgi:hypothetical protein